MIVGAVGGSVADGPAAPTRTRASTCLAVEHLRPVSEHADKIAWYAAAKDTARVRAWTCHRCDPAQYELCVLGAVWFIRRTVQRVVHETLRDTRAEAERLWWLLVAGGAR